MFPQAAPSPTTRKGIIGVHGTFDQPGRALTEAENEKKKSLYGNPRVKTNFNIPPGSIVFSMRGKTSGSDTLAVRHALDGLGADVAAMYDKDPDQAELVRAAVAAEIQPAGIVDRFVDANDLSTNNGVNIIKFGTVDVVANKNATRPIRAGDTVEAVPPDPTSLKASQRGGVPLEVRPVDITAPGAELLLHLRKLLDNPDKWFQAMSKKPHVASAFATAAANVNASYLAGALFFLQTLIEAGLYEPTDGAKAFFPADYDDKSLEEQAATEVATWADVFQLVATRPTYNSLNATQKQIFNSIKLKASRRIFYGPDSASKKANIADEFGFIPSAGGNLAQFLARYKNGMGIKSNDVYGDTLKLQQQHVARAVAGYTHAIRERDRNVIGTALRDQTDRVSLFLNVKP